MARTSYFDRNTLDFLAELTMNNEKPWFEANRKRYEQHVVEPAMAYIADMSEVVQSISRHYVAIPKKSGGSLMRVHRDTRFSREKTPYKTNIGIQFRHETGKDVHAPGFYLHIEPTECFLGAGVWHPEPDALQHIRQRVVKKPKEWQAVITDKGFTKFWTREGDKLSRPPKGYDAEHPLIEDLKFKDHIASLDFKPKELPKMDLLSFSAERFAAAAPYMRFLCQAQGLAF